MTTSDLPAERPPAEGFLQSLNSGVGHLKAGFLGFAGSGKTFTAVELAIGTRDHFGLDGPIAMFDTEGGAAYVAPRIKEATGQDLVGVKSRSIDDLMSMARECVNSNVSVLIVDSVTHAWRNLCDSYLNRINEERRRKRWRELERLEFHHWNRLKPIWYRWTDLYLNAPLHIIVCGRAGFEYDMPVNEETGKRELVKVGTKMKTEAEFGFEPSLLVEMEREPVREQLTTKDFIHRATVLKDRFDVLDGKSANDPTFEFFLPHVQQLASGAQNEVDVDSGPEIHVDLDGGSDWSREKKKRKIISEEIQGMLTDIWPSRKQEDVKAKGAALQECFGTTSWTKISEDTPSTELADGKMLLREYINRALDADIAAEQATE